VGSITTKTLGDLGAEVIKVETRARPCLSRQDVQVSASRADSLDDKPWFAHLNTSKRSLALDMKKPESREVLEPLVRWADVVVENFSPGTMAKLGLDYEQLVKLNPALVMISGSVYGQTGPLAQSWGVDGTGAALSGRTFLTGWPDRDPVIPSALPYGDVIVPFVMAAAAAAAVQYRREQARGCHIDVSMYEVCVQQMSPSLVAAQAGQRPARSGNADASAFHQGVYAAAGQERYVALRCNEWSHWQQLCALAQLPTASVAQVESMLAAWIATQNAASLIERCQAAGIEAGLVQDIEDMSEHDPQLQQRQVLVPLEHPLLGCFGHLRTPMQFASTPLEIFRAPGLGEHSEAIARDTAALSEERYRQLDAMGVFQ